MNLKNIHILIGVLICLAIGKIIVFWWGIDIDKVEE